MNLKESFEVHNELNPKLFSGEKLKPDVRDKILEAVEVFVDDLKIKPEILDIQLLGSNASYNYTANSDLDIHLIVNFEMIDSNVELVQALYELEKTSFNKNYDIKIKGIEVEFYIEDVNAGACSNGIYSVMNDNWIKFPRRIDDIPQFDLSKQVNIWKSKIERTLKRDDKDDIISLINTLYMIRKNSIAVDGEYGKGNQLFKEIRNLGLLQKLKDRYKEVVSKELSLESMLEWMTPNMAFKEDF